jgi:porin
MPKRLIRPQLRGTLSQRRQFCESFGVKTAFVATLLANTAAFAAPPPISVPISSESSASGQTTNLAGFLENLKRSNYMLGDMFGLRSWLSRYGISLAVQETSEYLGNVSGGTRKGAQYDGLTQMVMQMDTNRAFGWYGGLFNVSALQIHGQNLSTDNLGTLQTASGIEADRSTRLWEMWYDQKFLEEDRLDIKVGQQSVDQEFIVSQNASYFVNTMFGWPALPSYNMPGGGPAYPLSALGVRFRYRPIDPLTFLVGVFNGSPVSNNQLPAGWRPSDHGRNAICVSGARQHGVSGRGRAVGAHLSPGRVV